MRAFAFCLLCLVAASGCTRTKGPSQTLDKYGRALKNHDFGSAYDLMSSSFRGKVSREDYVRMMRDNPRVAIKPPPFEIPPFELKMAWSPLLQRNPGHQWMRRLIGEVARELDGDAAA